MANDMNPQTQLDLAAMSAEIGEVAALFAQRCMMLSGEKGALIKRVAALENELAEVKKQPKPEAP